MHVKYTLYSWLLTSIIGTIGSIIMLTVLVKGEPGWLLQPEVFMLILICLCSILVLSIPVFAGYHAVATYLYRTSRDPVRVRLLLSAYAAVTTLLTAQIFIALTGSRTEGEGANLFVLCIPHMVLFIISIWIWRPVQTNHANGENAIDPWDLAQADPKPANKAPRPFPMQLFITIVLIVASLYAFDLFYYGPFWNKQEYLGYSIRAGIFFAVNIASLVLVGKRMAAGWYMQTALSASTIVSYLFFFIQIRRLGHISFPLAMQVYLFPVFNLTVLLLICNRRFLRFFHVDNNRLFLALLSGTILSVLIMVLK